MALEGTLEDFSLADIFQLIGIQRKTGVLSLKKADETVTVKFHNGMVVSADSHPRKLEDRIGKVLVKTGLITPDQLRGALEQQQRTLQKIGFVLVDQNYITRDQLKEALQIQIQQMIYRLFRWHSGEYYFDQKASVDPNADESIPPMSAESILMEGIQMIDEWPIIEKRITNFDQVFQPTVQLSEIDLRELSADSEVDSMLNGLEKSAEGDEESEKIILSREEAEVFQFMDGRNSVSDIIESSRLGEFHTCKAIYDLLERKLVEPIRVAQPKVVIKEPTLPFLRPESEQKFNVVLFYPILGLIVLVLAIFGFSDPLKVPGAGFFQKENTEQMKNALSRSRIDRIDSAITFFFYVNGQLPQRLDELVQRDYLADSDLLDPWKKPYLYQAQGNGYVLAAQTRQGMVDSNLQISRILTTPGAVEETRTSGAVLEIEP